MADEEEKEEQQYLGVEILEAVEKTIKRIDVVIEKLDAESKRLETIETVLGRFGESIKSLDANMKIINQNQIKIAEKLGLSVEE